MHSCTPVSDGSWTALFVLGIALVLTSHGAAFGAIGGTLIRHQEVIIRVLGVLTIVLGLMVAGALGAVPGYRGPCGSATGRMSGWRARQGSG